MNIKKLWRYAPKWVFSTILAAAVPFGASNALAENNVYETTGSGKWVGFNPTAYENRTTLDSSLGAVPDTYKGHRWRVVSGQGTSRDRFNINDNQTWNLGDVLDYPGSTSYGTVYNDVIMNDTDTAIINSGHSIVLDSPLPGFGEAGKIGTLRILGGGKLDINSFTVGANTLVDNAGTLNVNGADVHADTAMKNTGTVNITGASNVTAALVNNSGTINITGSEDGIDATVFNNFITDGDTVNGTLKLTDSEVSFKEFNNGAGKIYLTDSTMTGGTTGLALKDGHEIHVTGENEITGTVSAENALNIIGTDATSKVTLGAVNYTGTGTKTLIVAKTQTVFDSTNLNGVEAVNVGAEGRIGGDGNAATAFTFGSDSWLNPGNSPGTFAVKSIDFTGGGFLMIEAEFGNDYDKVFADESIKFSAGTTTIYVDGQGAADEEFNNVVFLKSDANTTGGETITVDGANLEQSMVAVNGNEITVGTGVNFVVKSTKDDAGNDTVTFGTAQATNTTFGFDKITATGVTGEDPSTPTANPPVNPPGGGDTPAPIQGSSNYDTLFSVVNSIDMLGTDLNAAVGTAYAAAGSTEKAMIEIISQLDPVALSLGSVFTENAVYNFNHTMYDRIRLNTDYNYSGTMRGQDTCDPCEPIGCDPCDPCGSYGRGSSARQMWFQGIGGLANQDDANGIAGHETNMYGFALGVDRKISRNTVVGFSFGNTYYDTDMNRGLGSADAKNYLLSFYGGHKMGQWQFSGSGGYAMSELSSNRISTALGGWASSERDADTYFGSFEMARRFGNDYGYFTPFLGYDFVSYNEDAFVEKGNHISMSIQEREMEAYIQTLGARFGTKYQNRRGWIINPGMTLGWIHDFGSGQVKTTGQFNDGGSPFTVVGTSRHKNRALIGLNVDAALNNSLTIFGRYDGELANRYDSHTFQLGLAAQF